MVALKKKTAPLASSQYINKKGASLTLIGHFHIARRSPSFFLAACSASGRVIG